MNWGCICLPEARCRLPDDGGSAATGGGRKTVPKGAVGPCQRERSDRRRQANTAGGEKPTPLELRWAEMAGFGASSVQMPVARSAKGQVQPRAEAQGQLFDAVGVGPL